MCYKSTRMDNGEMKLLQDPTTELSGRCRAELFRNSSRCRIMSVNHEASFPFTATFEALTATPDRVDS